ncbi:MAG: acetyl-CoA carboxylase biotin carboxylase subunit [Fimbriimonadaceae bacterium]
MLKKVLVANRGEIACRVMRACREMGIPSVAVYSQADKDSLHALIADEAICVGAGSNADSYLNLANILMAAQISGADAVHPGYGYFSERAHFAEALAELGIKFIGPPVSAIEAMGDKARAKEAAIASGCPVVPGSDGAVASDIEALKVAEEIGYPILLKAVAGGGGRGIRRVDEPDELPAAFKTAAAEAQASFGSGEMLVEKCVVNPRHVEIQIIGDQHGNMVYLGERECSIQNLRHQKIVEEAPFAQLPAEVRRKMGEAAVKVAWSVGYQNAGTVEFLVDDKFDYYFLEMNTRLQVEHPVTEEITGIDLMQTMLRIAAGEKLPFTQADIQLKGHAIEARITAQDPATDFSPSTGLITQWRSPGGRGVRMDTHCYAGFTVSPFYDPMLAKLIVVGKDRAEAVARLQSALHEFEVEGIKTNIPFLRKLVAADDYVSGDFHTGWVPRWLTEGGLD